MEENIYDELQIWQHLLSWLFNIRNSDKCRNGTIIKRHLTILLVIKSTFYCALLIMIDRRQVMTRQYEEIYQKTNWIINLFFKYEVLIQYLVSSEGRLTYGEVRVLLQKNQGLTSFYKSITTSSNNTIRLTGNHLIYARTTSAEFFLPK